MSKVKKFLPYVVLGFMVAVPTALSFYFYSAWNGLKQDPQQQLEEDAVALISEVSELMILPTDEEPTIATVTDPEQLKTQAFFAHASLGDKVLIYTSARKAILYSPEEHKIIEVAPLNLGESAPPTVPPEQEPEPVVAGDSTEVAAEVTP